MKNVTSIYIYILSYFPYFITSVILLDKNSSLGIKDSDSPKVQLIPKIMAQTWEVIDSPMFVAAVKEAVDKYFLLFFDQLKRSVFLKDNRVDSAINNMKTQPLAILLTRIQSISTNMIPTESSMLMHTSGGGGNINSNILILEDMMSGPVLDALCTSVFDASSLSN
jgi:hypothetical protein